MSKKLEKIKMVGNYAIITAASTVASMGTGLLFGGGLGRLVEVAYCAINGEQISFFPDEMFYANSNSSLDDLSTFVQVGAAGTTAGIAGCFANDLYRDLKSELKEIDLKYEEN
ncbi:hypothetical protein HN865_04875 [Candidatus Woesearchaeota archaeon]|jgi:hypothetical protein|nr:hypothetical protein [Candidatus Woesearchaeota archaeon]MBT7238157.1 hypothetical protein [Candidatus Woesearchaeota archaeon]